MLTALRWALSIGNKFSRVVPGVTLLIVFATLVSQISILLAFLLPLKILMLLGSSQIPHYFPSLFTHMDRELLILSLSMSAVVFYMLFLIAEKAIVICSSRGATLLLRRSQKIILFENQDEVASRGYQRYSRSLAGSVFLGLVAVVMACLYPELLGVLVVYIIVAFMLLAFFYSKNRKLKVAVDEVPGQVVSTATNIGFLCSFIFMVWDFLWGTPPGLLIAIISLILMRQGFTRIAGVVNDLKGLYVQRLKLNALFFHGHVLVNETRKHETNFWSLLKFPQREQWMLSMLREVVSSSIDEVKISWWHLGGLDVAAFHVQGFDKEGALVSENLVKLFNSNRGSLAKHEATLLIGNAELPALPLKGVESLGDLHCHIFEWLPIEKPPLKQINETRQAALEILLAIEPNKTLSSQFMRSRPPIWQRIDAHMFERLHTVAEMMGPPQVENVERLRKAHDVIKDRLSKLPLVIVNPDQGPDAFLQTEEGELLMAQWGRWALEPVGANWPIHPKQLDLLASALDRAKLSRRALHKVSAADACITALIFSLEKSYVRQDFVMALDLIPRVLKCLEEEPNMSGAST